MRARRPPGNRAMAPSATHVCLAALLGWRLRRVCAVPDEVNCAAWCTRWTCNNEVYCGGCDASICEGPEPHGMCNSPAQPPRGASLRAWCSHDAGPVASCEHAECSGCGYCRTIPMPSPLAVPTREDEPSQEPDATKACEVEYLEQVKAELRSMVESQKVKNHELRNALGATSLPAMPPRPPVIPPLPPKAPSPAPPNPPAPPPCVSLGHQCGGLSWSGPAECCQAAGLATRVCRRFSEAFSGCRTEDDETGA